MESVKIENGQIFMDEDVLGALAFASEAEQSAILGDLARAISKQPAAQQGRLIQQAIRKVARPSAGNVAVGKDATSRDEVLRRMDGLDPTVISGLMDKRLSIVDSRYYWVKVLNTASTLKMIKNDDAKAAGVTNVSLGKLDEGAWFLLTGIILLSGVATDKLNTAFAAVALAIANGDFEFRANGNKAILPKDTSANIFLTGRTDQPVGYYRLENPKWIKPQQEMMFDLTCSQAGAANTNVRLELCGASIATY